MRIENEKAFAIVSKGSGAASNAAKAVAIKATGFKDMLILDELAVKDPVNFGKGYGKELFLKVLKTIKNPLVLIPFGVFYPTKEVCYAGRKKLDTVEDMVEAPKELLRKFYIPLIEKSNKNYKILKTEGNVDFIVVY